jgi:hypothetical protein
MLPEIIDCSTNRGWLYTTPRLAELGGPLPRWA